MDIELLRQFGQRRLAIDRGQSQVDSDTKCNTWGARAHQGKIGFSPSSPPPSAAFRRCEGGSEERKIE
jgi:hypothetical protein